jgi:class 3 adenylate cyclase
LLGTLLPLTLFGLAMSFIAGLRGDFVLPPFMVSSAADDRSYPTVSRVFVVTPGLPVSVGDPVVELEGTDVRGMSLLQYMLRWSAAARTQRSSIAVVVEHGGVRAAIRPPLLPGFMYPGVPWWTPLPFVASLIATALLVLVRAPHWHLRRRVYVACLLVALADMPYFQVPTAPKAFVVTALAGLPIACGLVLRTLYEFIPDVHLWNARRSALTWGLSAVLSAGAVGLFWLPPTGLGAFLVGAALLALVGFGVAWPLALTQVYRRAGPLGRRQLKWILYGQYVGSLPIAFVYLAELLGLWSEWREVYFAVAMVTAAAIPLGALVAIVFYQFLDIDRLFGATLSYSVLAVVGITLLLGLVPTASRAASEAMGIDATQGQLLLAVGIAIVLVPTQRAVRPRIDGMLFPERVTLEQGFEQLLGEIAACTDATELMTTMAERFDALLRPVSAVTYVRAGDVFAPVVVRGRNAVAPPFSVRSSLIAALDGRTGPLAAERWTARRTQSLTPFERAAIETLDVAVLLPIRRGADLIGFSCLGPKRSGDIYTPTDLALLGAVAGRISDRFLSLESAALSDKAHATQEALRRYVPGAVARRVVDGQDLAAEEREVSVLFVDIRGYSGIAERRAAEEIFRTVNDYTETVSRLVQARGGVVVEFHGDGLLAVFGAPEEVAMKERAAVQAARDIVAAVPKLGGAARGSPELSVGVGIATGPAFVGNIQSADRLIWTVIGDTVNLAARLQSLTRELQAAVAIDDSTFRCATGACTDFDRHADLPIRGRLRPETVHALPLG